MKYAHFTQNVYALSAQEKTVKEYQWARAVVRTLKLRPSSSRRIFNRQAKRRIFLPEARDNVFTQDLRKGQQIFRFGLRSAVNVIILDVIPLGAA